MKFPLVVRLLVSTVAVAVTGCGGGGDGDTPVDASGTSADAAIPADYARLIGRTWTLPAGARDTYKCMRVTVAADTYITNILAEAPQGTHHTVLSIANTNSTRGPDGEYDCGVGTLGLKMLFASGVGTPALDFPPGVGVKIAAGEQIHLNLHLYNASDSPITGDSGILVKSQPTAPPMLAENVFAGRLNFSIPVDNDDIPETVVGGCTVQAPYTLFAVWPHMHQWARHSKLELIRGSETQVLYDGAYTFLEQHYYRKDPMVQVQAGDQIRVTCSYLNKSDSAVGFGDSSDTEMCFTGLYRYPATNAGLFQCTDVPSGGGF